MEIKSRSYWKPRTHGKMISENELGMMNESDLTFTVNIVDYNRRGSVDRWFPDFKRCEAHAGIKKRGTREKRWINGSFQTEPKKAEAWSNSSEFRIVLFPRRPGFTIRRTRNTELHLSDATWICNQLILLTTQERYPSDPSSILPTVHMEMNPIYTGNLEPMGGYSRMSSEDEPDLVPQDTGSASRCHQRALMLITLLCCLLLSSNVVLLNLYMKQSSVAQETLQNISKLRSDEATLSDENLRLNRQIEALTSRNTDLQTENSAGLLSNAALKTQNRNLTELLALCREENVELAVTNSNLTRTHGLLKDQAEELRNLSRLQQSQIANLSQSQDRLLEENLALASTDSTLLQWLEGLADRGENLTAEVARLSAEEHELALQYSALEKHCHTVQRPRRGPHNHHSKNNNDLTGKSLYFPHGGADRLVTFMPNQKKPLTAVTLCLRHSSNLAWGVSLLSPANREEMASFQCHPQECRVLVNGVTSTAGLGDASGPAESWSHTCTTWRSDTAAVQLWVNGVASAKHRGSGQRTEWLVESITLQRLAGSGLVTDLHLWDYALTDCQIQTLAAGLSITTGNLLEWSNLSRRHAGQGEIQIKPLQESCSGSH